MQDLTQDLMGIGREDLWDQSAAWSTHTGTVGRGNGLVHFSCLEEVGRSYRVI